VANQNDPMALYHTLQPDEEPGCPFYVSQPGSSIATSLAEGEAAQKYVPGCMLYLLFFCSAFVSQPVLF
jgi:hypothetical protein